MYLKKTTLTQMTAVGNKSTVVLKRGIISLRKACCSAVHTGHTPGTGCSPSVDLATAGSS